MFLRLDRGSFAMLCSSPGLIEDQSRGSQGSFFLNPFEPLVNPFLKAIVGYLIFLIFQYAFDISLLVYYLYCCIVLAVIVLAIKRFIKPANCFSFIRFAPIRKSIFIQPLYQIVFLALPFFQKSTFIFKSFPHI